MKHLVVSIICSFVCTTFVMAATTSNLMINGSCDNPENPWKYWTYDYTPMQNENYAQNTKYVSMLPEFAGKKNVIKMVINDDKGYKDQPMWWIGVKVDSPLIPFEQGCRYRFSISVMASATYHIYVMGYQFKPGVKPYENPSLFDMRLRYKGDFNREGDKKVSSKGWDRIIRDFPAPQLSKVAMQNIKAVKYISLHCIGITSKGEMYLKDLVVEKLSEGYKGGKITEDDRRSVAPDKK
ncbi:MAG: hypothetical protein PHI84_06475 [Kiritimatiellae bacterium]|nr:hypothetical protein [Kiritimatiellia bacterium]